MKQSEVIVHDDRGVLNKFKDANEQLQVIEQKLVPFGNTEILAVKMSDGELYAAVKWVCQGIGLSEGQQKHERKKVQEDLVLSKGVRNFVLPTNGGLQEVLCIGLEFLPLWLAKISITPAMQQEVPWTVNNLVEFQLGAKRVLADAFIKKEQPKTQAEIIAMLAQHNVEQERRLNEVEQRTAQIAAQQENIEQIVTLNQNDWRDKVNLLINKIAVGLGGGEQFRAVRNQSYEVLEKRARCKLDVRLENRKKNALAHGVLSKNKISKFSKLDVIADDTRLTEIYLAVVKDMAIKNKVNAEGMVF